MTDPIDPGNTEFVLPIICPHCSKEINLSMGFSLLPPKKEEEEGTKENEPKEVAPEEA